MKLICNGLDLSDAVLKVVKAIGSKTTNPILEGIKLNAYQNVVTLTATDLELTIEKKINADVLVEGETVIPGKYFADFMRKLEKDEIELTLNDNKQLRIKYTDSEGYLQCMDESEYPEVYKVGDSKSFFIKFADLKKIIKNTIFAVCADDSRPILKGLLFDIKDNLLEVVGIDGYRMATAKCAVKSSENMRVVIPSRSLGEIAKIMVDSEDDEIEIKVSKSYIMVDVSDVKIITRLIEGDFINHNQIIPASFTTDIVIKTEDFSDGLDRASIMSKNEKNNLVMFDIKENNMQLTSHSEIGNIKENIDLKLNGKDINIAFNSRYFSDCLKVIDDDFIKIYFNSPVSPCVIKPVTDDNYLFLILPVKINA